MSKIIQKILIANRGEIAVRIIKTAKKLGVKTVAVFSDSDNDSWHKELADEAYPLASGDLKDTYLNIDKIISIAKASNADAIHPGYGFLSENAKFALACEQNNLIFIGPTSKVMQQMGNKIEARKIAKEIDIPITESVEGSIDELMKKDIEISYPLIVKAAAGGGGKGMKIINSKSELKENLESAFREATNYFGDGTVYIEKYIENPRHIEVQILADNFGNCIHLFERECTIQRRHQKIIEEAPSPTLTEEVRQEITMAAVKIAKHIGYNNVGTIEFLVDQQLNFYFLEMNTRIQVEHPITEMITGIDIVEEQISVAKGNPLRFIQDDIQRNGHAIECRIYAENPSNNFLPAPGNITLYKAPDMENIRIDSSINRVTAIKSEFDPMIAKLVSWGENREDARSRMLKALDEYYILGIENNISYLKEIHNHPAFIENSLSTSFCNLYTSEIIDGINDKIKRYPINNIIGGFLLFELIPKSNDSLWKQVGFWRDSMSINIKINEILHSIEILERNQNQIVYKLDNNTCKAILYQNNEGVYEYTANDIYCKTAFSSIDSSKTLLTNQGLNFTIERLNVLQTDILHEASNIHTGDIGNTVHSPMFGKLIKINVQEGDIVRKGETLLVLEAMKMENNITAHKNACIEKIHVKAGQMIESNNLLISFIEEV